MQAKRILKSKINTTLIVIVVIAIVSVFLPWAHGKGSISYSGGGFSGGGSARTASVSGIGFGSGAASLLVCLAYINFLWKKKIAPRVLFVLLPWIIFFSAFSFLTTLNNASSFASSSVGEYGGTARARLEPDFGYFLFFLSSLLLLIVSPFRTRKATAMELATQGTEAEPADESTSVRKSDPLETIAKLKQMKDQGLITEEEFDKKKSEILARL